MKRSWWVFVVCALAVLVSSCGGGDGGLETSASNSASSSLPASPAPQRFAADTPLRSAQTTLFDWAQQHFPQFFTGASSDGVAGPFTFRFYSQTQTFLALSSDGGIYVKGPLSGDQVLFIAPLCVVVPDSCPVLAVGNSATGTLAASGDHDWYTVSLTAGQAYAFSLEGAATGQGTVTDPLLRLFNSAGQQVTSDDDSGVSFNASMVCAPSAGGTYFLSAEGTGGDTGTYKLTVSAVPGAAVACESRPNDPGIDWNTPVSAPGILQGTVTLGAQQIAGVGFSVTGGPLSLESIFVSQGSADLYVMNSADLPACLAGGTFNFIAEASFERQTGFRSFALDPGSYAICARNQTAAPNTVRLELQQATAAAGFHFSRQQFTPLALTVPAAGRVVQPVAAGDVYRIFLDGANTGGIFYIIPPDQAAPFMAGQPFEHYPELTAACGGLGAAGTAAPVPCELPGVAQYNIAYINDTGAAQSIVVVGREYTPD